MVAFIMCRIATKQAQPAARLYVYHNDRKDMVAL